MTSGLHPKVAWPLLVNSILTILATVVAAWQKGGSAAALTALVAGALTVVGAVTGYSVSSPPAPIAAVQYTATPPVVTPTP